MALPEVCEVVHQTLRRRVVGDLDNIVLKCLRRDPRQRYETAKELAGWRGGGLHPGGLADGIQGVASAAGTDGDTPAIGQFALHIQCPWRLVTPQPPWLPPRTDPMVTGSGDWWEPAEHREDLDWDRWNEHRATPSMQEKLLQALFQEYDTETKSYLNTSDRLIVEQVEADDYGGLNIHLSGGFRLQAFPNRISGEHWRLFQPGTENLHLAMRDGKLTEA